MTLRSPRCTRDPARCALRRPAIRKPRIWGYDGTRTGADHSRGAGTTGDATVRERAFPILDGALARRSNRELDGRNPGADPATRAAGCGVPLRLRAARRRDLVVPLPSSDLGADRARALRGARGRGAQRPRGRLGRGASPRRLAPHERRRYPRELRRPARLGPRGPHGQLDHGQRRRRVEPGVVAVRAPAASPRQRGECTDLHAGAEPHGSLGGGAGWTTAPGTDARRGVGALAGRARRLDRRRGRGRGGGGLFS